MRRLAVAVAVAVGVLAGAGSAARAATLAQVGTFNQPVYVTAPGNDARLFVVERGGTVRVVRGGTALPTPFLDITSRITSAGQEEGLLSIAFPPDYATSGLFYAYFTNTTQDVEVDELRRSASNEDLADPSYRRMLFTFDHREFQNHNGGNLQFGPDGLLYAGTGDGGGGGDPHGNAQNDNVLLGKLLRIQASAPGARPEIFAKGLRNPWRFSFDRQTGDLVIADVGQGRVEEVDFAPAPGRGQGANYGWNRYEGNEDFSNGQPVGNPPPAGFAFPVVTHSHADGWCSITGGYVVRDASVPELAGRYVYSDFCKGDIYSATLPGGRDDGPTGLHVGGASSFGEDSCGHVYVTSLNGPVYLLSSGASGGCPVKGPPPGDGTTPGPDRTAPSVRISVSRRVRSASTLRFAVTCDEQCTIAATARTLDRRAGTLRRTLASGARVTLRLALSRSARGALRRALRRHRSVTLLLGVRARDAAGNVGRARVRVRIVRR